MSIKCWEMQDSMSGSIANDLESGETRTVKRRYLIGQCDGFNVAAEEVTKYAPRYVNGDGFGLYWVRRQLDVTGIGNRYFDCVATYETLVANASGGGDSSSGSPAAGSVAWDTTGNTEHITQGLTAETSIPANAPYFHGALNVSGDSVNGVDVVRPALKYSETWILPASVAVSVSFVGSVYGCTGTVNSETFRAFAPGEALFIGARGQWSGDSPTVAVTFDFQCRPNKDSVYVEGLTGIAKKGWQHLWIRYEAESDSGTIVRKPIAAYVNDVYESKSWAGLLIGSQLIGQAKTPVVPVTPEQGLQ